MEENKKMVTTEEPVQQQPINLTVKLTNIDELKQLITDINKKIHQLNNFKLQISISNKKEIVADVPVQEHNSFKTINQLRAKYGLATIEDGDVILCHKHLEELLNKYKETTNLLAKGFVDELKRDAETYKQVEENLMIFKKAIIFKHPDYKNYEYFFNEVKRLLMEEKNDLPLTNRS